MFNFSIAGIELIQVFHSDQKVIYELLLEGVLRDFRVKLLFSAQLLSREKEHASIYVSLINILSE